MSDLSSVSVLLPVYNERPDWLRKAYSSLLSQTLPPTEILLLDDGSTNLETLAELGRAAELDSRLVVHRLPHRGLVDCLNYGTLVATSEILLRQDSDDWSAPERVELIVRAFQANSDLALVGTNFLMHKENGVPIWGSCLPETSDEIRKQILARNVFCHGSVGLRRSAVLAVGGYRSEIRECEDYDLWLRLVERYSSINLPDHAYHYRRTGQTLTVLRGAEMHRWKMIVRECARQRAVGLENLKVAQATVDITSEAVLTPMVITLLSADQLLLAGRYREAVSGYIMAIREGPRSIIGYLKVARAGCFILMPVGRIRRALFSSNPLRTSCAFRRFNRQ